MARRLLFVCNDPAFFAAQHMHVAESARTAGYDVHVATPDWGGREEIEEANFTWHELDMRRGMVNPLNVMRVLGQMVSLYRRLKPHLVMHITLKPIMLGTLAANITGVDAVVNYNTGLGYTFIDERPLTRWIRRFFVYGYKAWMGHKKKVDVFLNPDDLNVFKRLGLSEARTSRVISGPGVDIKEFHPVPEPNGKPIVVLASRMLWHKGVGEFIEAARNLKREGVQARFVLAGDPDEGNLASVTKEDLEAAEKEGVVEWWGYQTDMPAVFQQASIGVLPSYREGLGKVLIEAAACGRPVVATDVAGCREVARDGVNGYLVPVRNARRLGEAIRRLLEQPELRKRMGENGRRIVEREFSNQIVAHEFLNLFDHLLLPKTVKRLHPISLSRKHPAYVVRVDGEHAQTAPVL